MLAVDRRSTRRSKLSLCFGFALLLASCGGGQEHPREPESALHPPKMADDVAVRHNAGGPLPIDYASKAKSSSVDDTALAEAPHEAAPLAEDAPGDPEAAAESDDGENGAAGPADAAHGLAVEAGIRMAVEDVWRASEAVKQIAARAGGVVTESRTVRVFGDQRAAFVLRVPVKNVHALLAAIARLGHEEQRDVNARDVTKDYRATELRLENLERALERMQQILATASGVDEVLRVEEELERIRGRIEAVKGEMQWLRDHSAEALVRVLLLTAHAPEPVVREYGWKKPSATLYPGVRAVYVRDLGGSGDPTYDYFGGGLSLNFFDHLGIDLDLLDSPDVDEDALDGLVFTFGVDTFSDFLGAGKRRFLNPYLGARAGFARFGEKGSFTAGATIGVELWKTDVFRCDLDVRGFLLLGDFGARFVLEPALGAHVAF